MVLTALDTSYDGVAILDCLSADERTKFGDSAKLRALVHSIRPDIALKYIECSTRSEYLAALTELAREARESDLRYRLHLECHGSPDGIEVGAAHEKVSWQDQVQELRDLNSAMGGALIVDVMACNAIHGSKMAPLASSPLPFYAIVGPGLIVASECAATLTEAFYRAFLGLGEFNAAIAAANAALGKQVILGIRADVFIQQQQAGFPFRPNKAHDKLTVCCRGDGTVYLATDCA